MQDHVPIEKNLIQIKNLITAYEKKYEREPGSVQLLAVSKKQSLEKIQYAFQAGQRSFGESYLQEALTKITVLPSAEWHFIGPIQSNKTRKIAEYFSWVQSVDSIKIAERLHEQRPSHLPKLNICIQVNLDDEPTKSGVSLTEVESLTLYCQKLPRLQLRGLMAIPKEQQDFNAKRRSFHQIFLKFSELKNKGISFDTLSMGMSGDFEAAIAENSTLLRIGTAIFGPR